MFEAEAGDVRPIRRLGRDGLPCIEIPKDLEDVLAAAWEAARDVPGFLLEDEARLLGMIAACVRCDGAIVEIGSFKGKSTVMLATVAKHYGLGPVVAIDPHNFNSAELQEHRTSPESSSYGDFLRNLETAGVSGHVEPHRALSGAIASGWNRPIRFLWIDGDHSYQGAKTDFDGFSPYVTPHGIVAFHDALHEFAGPLRVFVEDVLRSDRFGAAGFVRSIAWSQFRPADGGLFRKERGDLERIARRVLPYIRNERPPRGVEKILFKLSRARVPRGRVTPAQWVSVLNERQEDASIQ
jgi:MMP 1-O-methyltransferase